MSGDTLAPHQQARRKEILEYVTKIVQARAAAGYTPDGRLLDMAKYSAHLKSQRDAGRLLENDHL